MDIARKGNDSSTDRRVIGLYHWKLTCILVFLFPHLLGYHWLVCRSCTSFLSCSSPLLSFIQQREWFNGSSVHSYLPPTCICSTLCLHQKKEKQNTEGLVSSLTSVLRATLCLTSSPGGPGGGTPLGMEWGTGAEYPEGMVTSLYLR